MLIILIQCSSFNLSTFDPQKLLTQSSPRSVVSKPSKSFLARCQVAIADLFPRDFDIRSTVENKLFRDNLLITFPRSLASSRRLKVLWRNGCLMFQKIIVIKGDSHGQQLVFKVLTDYLFNQRQLTCRHYSVLTVNILPDCHASLLTFPPCQPWDI